MFLSTGESPKAARPEALKRSQPQEQRNTGKGTIPQVSPVASAPQDPKLTWMPYKENEWIKVPASLIQTADGWSVLPFLFVPPEDDFQGATASLGQKLHLAPTEDVQLQHILNEAMQQWAKMAVNKCQQVNTTTWKISTTAEELSAITDQMETKIQTAIGMERSYVFKCLAIRSMDSVFKNLQFRIEFKEEGHRILIGESGALGLMLEPSQIAPSSPLGVLLASFKR